MTNLINNGDSVTQSLGKLYRKHGYSRYKMSRFEEYDTYVQNKDFLISDRVITFTDVSGKLLAMKPDVTISIIKNTDESDGYIHKVYYKENVYRVSNGSHGFKEIMQMGLECIGDIDAYSISEVIVLAAKSLEAVSGNYVLDISHMGFVSGLLSEAGFSPIQTNEVLKAIGEKNIPQLDLICKNNGLSWELTSKITGLVDVYGSMDDIASKLDDLCVNEQTRNALDELCEIFDVLKCANLSDKVKIDFSVVNDMNYYNGLVFRGYIEGIPTGVLSGGQYDKLMSKMGKKTKALGFAVYLDLLEMFNSDENVYDADILIRYKDSHSPSYVYAEAQKYINAGKSVLVIKNSETQAHCREMINL